jgi:hypothetical protein
MHERCLAGSGGSGHGGLSTEAAWWTDSIMTLVAVTLKERSRGTAMVRFVCGGTLSHAWKLNFSSKSILGGVGDRMIFIRYFWRSNHRRVLG